MKKLMLIGFIISLIFLFGCTETPTGEVIQPVCNKPYILVGTDCCLDKNDNSICDKDEIEESKVEETKETKSAVVGDVFPCEDECNFEGQKCEDNKVIKCVNSDNDVCKEKTTIKECTVNEKCDTTKNECIIKPTVCTNLFIKYETTEPYEETEIYIETEQVEVEGLIDHNEHPECCTQNVLGDWICSHPCYETKEVEKTREVTKYKEVERTKEKEICGEKILNYCTQTTLGDFKCPICTETTLGDLVCNK